MTFIRHPLFFFFFPYVCHHRVCVCVRTRGVLPTYLHGLDNTYLTYYTEPRSSSCYTVQGPAGGFGGGKLLCYIHEIPWNVSCAPSPHLEFFLGLAHKYGGPWRHVTIYTYIHIRFCAS